MFQHVVRRLLAAIPVVLITTFLVFFLLRMIPGDPALSLAGQDPTPEQVDAIRRELQLDQPILVQYVSWIGRVVVGDFGRSYVFKREVSELIGATFPATLELNIVAMFIAVAIGIPFGAVAALKPNSRWSAALAGLSAFTMGIPPFLMGLIYLLVFALVLGWLPPGGRVSLTENPLGAARSIILPALTMGLPSAMFFARFVFSALNNVLAQDYVRTARGKGLSPRTVTYPPCLAQCHAAGRHRHGHAVRAPAWRDRRR